MASGWAVRISGRGILVETVSPHRRGAIVNFLWTYCYRKIRNDHNDAYIEELWGHDKLGAGAEVIEVEVIGK